MQATSTFINNYNNQSNVLTIEEARKSVQDMCLINAFLFDSVLENEEDAKLVISNILSTIFNKQIDVKSVTSQKSFQAVDTQYHGIRMDAYINPVDNDEKIIATVYDVEMEDRITDKKELPRRLRYYGALHDDKYLKASHNYKSLPDFITITILSYDPFSAGDMYYESRSTLTTHPNVEYDEGITHIFLYCGGTPNIKDISHSKKLTEMLKYIQTGEKPTTPNSRINDIDKVVSLVKARPEVTTNYMKQWLREQVLKQELTEQVTQQTKHNAAIRFIIFSQIHNISDDVIKAELITNYGYKDIEIPPLYQEAAKERNSKS